MFHLTQFIILNQEYQKKSNIGQEKTGGKES